MPQRPVDQFVRGRDLVVRKLLRRFDVGQGRRRVAAGQVAVDECADHVVVRHAGQVTGRVQPGTVVRACSSTHTPEAECPLHKPISEMCISMSWVR